ncbi:MAG TPA: 30S ribosome-binding factor RbfA [Candidatus Eisenbacteria bacterium]|nr:30S ribosome-binding factor RbfA [Candidatus Eisenbacteria bacterium]
MADHRRERVEHLLRAELASLLQREARDPRLATVTVSAVRMTADLRQARVFYRVLGDPADVAPVQKGLDHATPFLRARVARSLGLRVTPTLRFEYDTTPDTARRVDDLLRSATPGSSEDEET